MPTYQTPTGTVKFDPETASMTLWVRPLAKDENGEPIPQPMSERLIATVRLGDGRRRSVLVADYTSITAIDPRAVIAGAIDEENLTEQA